VGFVTYAQNFEDLMLMRALHHVENGFYIDVGANDPELESVTKVFYDRGWRGINIEPGFEAFAKLNLLRTRDVNLNLAVWSHEGEKTFFVVEDCSALSTFSSALAESYRGTGRKISERSVPVRTLASICAEHAVDRPIHFLKVDVEESELEVFEGHDFTRWRPWIVLAEAHGPDLKSTRHEPWQNLLQTAGYRFIYNDGLNRFFIADEHFEALKDAFLVPPNVHDAWVRHSDCVCLNWATQRAEAAEQQVSVLRQAEARAKRALAERDAYHQELFETNRHAAWLSCERQRLIDDVAELHASTSWRVTAPLRAMRHWKRRVWGR
jgi:FkbM family methyltransferase